MVGNPDSGTDLDMIAMQWGRHYITPQMRDKIAEEVQERLRSDFLPETWVITLMPYVRNLIATEDVVNLADLASALEVEGIPVFDDYVQSLYERD